MVLALLSISTNRNLVLKLKQGDVLPNMWIFFLGRSTISRKTAAISKGQEIALDLFSYISLPQSYSPEGMIEELADKPKAYLFKDEAGAMLEAMQKKYMLEMRDLYCILYDCQSYSRKLRKGQRKEQTEFFISKPFINIVCATTPETFREYTTMLDLTSGWLLRFLYFYPTYRKDWMAFKPETEEDLTLYSEISGRILKIKKILFTLEEPVQIDLSPEGWAYYQAWQEMREKELQESTNSIELALWGRLSFYALKLAILFTIGKSDYTIETQISLEYIKEACRQVDEYFLPIGAIVAEEVAREEKQNLQNKIIGILNRNGGKIKRRDLLKNLHVKLKDVEEALEALIESEELKVYAVEKIQWVLLRRKNRKSWSEVKPKPITSSQVPQMSTMSHNNKCRMNSDSIYGIQETDGTHATPATDGTVRTPPTPPPLPRNSSFSDSPTMSPHLRRDLPTPQIEKTEPEEFTCPGCGIFSRSSQIFNGKKFCTGCPPKLVMLPSSVKALTEKLGRPPSIDEIFEDISKRGRSPMKKDLPSMLRSIGLEEKNGGWMIEEAAGVVKSIQSDDDGDRDEPYKTKEVEIIVKRLEQGGKPVTGYAICNALGFDKYEHRGDIISHLRELGYKVTDEIDPESRDSIMRRS
jgi:hypothetical protein